MIAAMKRRYPLSTWISEIFFEDNARFSRRVPRIRGMLIKAAKSIPHALVMAFSNFASTYPARRYDAQPQPHTPEIIDLTITEWPRHEDGRERGLPHSDSVVQSIDAGMSLAGVADLVFCMREIHRVCTAGATVRIRLAGERVLEADPTARRVVARASLAFFTRDRVDPDLALKADRLGVRGLFEIAGERDTEITLKAIKSGSPPRPLRIDIGSGTAVKDGYTGVDILALPGVDVVRDVERHGLPFSDSTITHVYTAHFLEHIRDLVFVMNEIHRVCCHDAIVEISVPSLIGPFAAADPTHVRLFNARTFSYFEAGGDEYAAITKGFEIIEQHVGLSIEVTLRVIKT
jgi:hypothetical protein